MFFEKLRSLQQSLALRLTLWYGGIFALSSSLAFVIIYLLMVAVVLERSEEDLEEDLSEMGAFYAEGGLQRLRSEMDAETAGEGAEDTFFRLWHADGRELLTTDLTFWGDLGPAPQTFLELDGNDEPILERLSLASREFDTLSIVGLIAPGAILQIGQSLEEDAEFKETFLKGFLLTLAVVILLGAPVGWFMARRALSGVDAVTRTATEIAGGALDRRVIVHSRGDELDRLAQAFNGMLDRIQALIIGMREMTDNLAHDLRSPLARIRASAEMTLVSGNASPDAEAVAATTTEECDRLLEMINTTLDIAEAESGAAKLDASEIDLVEIVLDACELFQTVAEDAQVNITTDLPKSCIIRGDRQRLQRVIANLLDNAVKYTPPNGQVAVKLLDEGKRVKLNIEDSGMGISPDEKRRIFQRFYRCDRSRTVLGNGLGLSLALAFTRAHGGDIEVSSNPGSGSVFSVLLPR